MGVTKSSIWLRQCDYHYVDTLAVYDYCVTCKWCVSGRDWICGSERATRAKDHPQQYVASPRLTYLWAAETKIGREVSEHLGGQTVSCCSYMTCIIVSGGIGCFGIFKSDKYRGH